MKNILIIGSTGQIGSELTMKLRREYQSGSVVAGYIAAMPPKGDLLESGPSELADITDSAQIASIVDKYKIDTIYNLAALLSATAEAKPQLAWHIGLGGLFNVLEIAREKGCAVFTPSSIGAFGDDVYKIGMTRRLEPTERVKELGDASVPFPFDIHAMIFSENAPELESKLHNVFANERVNMTNYRREFFNVSLDRIEEEAKKLGAKVEFTKLAEAEEYRESQILKKQINQQTMHNIKEFPDTI